MGSPHSVVRTAAHASDKPAPGAEETQPRSPASAAVFPGNLAQLFSEPAASQEHLERIAVTRRRHRRHRHRLCYHHRHQTESVRVRVGGPR